jgi:hypothetical protein
MKVKINFDTINKDWDIDTSMVDPYDDYVDFYFNFKQNGSEEVEFDNLKFGYAISFDGIPFGGEEYPKNTMQYIATDQTYLEISRVFGFRPNRTYYIDAWAENAGESFSEILPLEVPIPEQPYLSWTWNDDAAEWQPPFPPPDDGNMYQWIEETQSWTLVVID